MISQLNKLALGTGGPPPDSLLCLVGGILKEHLLWPGLKFQVLKRRQQTSSPALSQLLAQWVTEDSWGARLGGRPGPLLHAAVSLLPCSPLPPFPYTQDLQFHLAHLGFTSLPHPALTATSAGCRPC